MSIVLKDNSVKETTTTIENKILNFLCVYNFKLVYIGYAFPYVLLRKFVFVYEIF